jgi:putative colanic acid biosynthesis UDP-glucose lipid carrier transferase
VAAARRTPPSSVAAGGRRRLQWIVPSAYDAARSMKRQVSSSKGLLRGHEELVSALQRFSDFLIIGLGHYLSCLYFNDVWRPPMSAATLIAILIFNLAAEWRGLYRAWRSEKIRRELRVTITTWLVVPPILLALGFLTKTTESVSRAVTVGWFVGTGVGLCLWRVGGRLLLRYLRFKGRNTRSVAIIGATEVSHKLCKGLLDRPWLGLRLAAYYDDRPESRRHSFKDVPCPYGGTIADLIREAKAGNHEIVYIGLPLRAEGRISSILNELADTTATVYLTADFFTYDLLNGRWHQIGNVPLVSIYDSPFSGVAGWIKRLEDIVLGTLILCLIALPLLFFAIAVKVTSPGPIFFRQRRFGVNGKEIRILKFRTMTVLEDGDQIKQATKDDVRVTRLGRFMRRMSIDELPQFFQVIMGEMSIVGPRPHAVAHNQAYRSLIQGYMLRHKVKPGITGWAQVNGFRGETDTLDKMEQRVRYDLEYITEWYLGLDLKIIFMTIFKVMSKDNAH